jgi:hypothetical protein
MTQSRNSDDICVYVEPARRANLRSTEAGQMYRRNAIKVECALFVWAISVLIAVGMISGEGEIGSVVLCWHFAEATEQCRNVSYDVARTVSAQK